MEIIIRLSSRVGDKTEKSNRYVAGLCVANPEFINDIADGFLNKDSKL